MAALAFYLQNTKSADSIKEGERKKREIEKGKEKYRGEDREGCVVVLYSRRKYYCYHKNAK